MNRKMLALFDFDGTITRTDSLKEFIIFMKGRRNYYLGLLWLSPFLLLYKAGVIPNWKAKEILLAYFFKGTPVDVFEGKCKEFASWHVPKIIREKAMDKLSAYLNEGVRVVVVSASPENWVGKWSEANGLEWIATRLEVKKGRLTGKIVGRNCHGVEKVNRIKALIDISEFTEIHTFGDSKGDLQMLKLGTRSFYRPFV